MHSDLDKGLSSECEALLDVSKGAVQHGSEGVHSLAPPPHLLLYYLHTHHCQHQAKQTNSVQGLLGLVTLCPIWVPTLAQHMLCSLHKCLWPDILPFADTAVVFVETAEIALASWAQFPLDATTYEG